MVRGDQNVDGKAEAEEMIVRKAEALSERFGLL